MANAMPAANLQRKLDSPRKRKPNDTDRVETFSRIVIGRVRNPRDLDARGRGRLRLAFEDFKRADGTTGRLTELAQVPEGNMRGYLVTVAHGVTPPVAAAIWFGVETSTAWRWLEAGKDPNCPDEMKREFFLQTERAKSVARGDCEERVTLVDPLSALSRGPLGKKTEHVEGWESRQQIQHANYDGTGPAAFKLEITTGYATREEPRALTPGEAEEP